MRAPSTAALPPRAVTPPRPRQVFKTPDGGAATSVFAATHPYLNGKGGNFLKNCGIAAPSREGIMDAEEARRLWEVTEDMVGETLDLSSS